MRWPRDRPGGQFYVWGDEALLPHAVQVAAEMVLRLADRRDCQTEEEDDGPMPSSGVTRRLQAERASCQLLARMILLPAQPLGSVGATVRSFVDLLGQLLRASTAAGEPPITLTFHYRATPASTGLVQQVLALVLDLVVRALDDGAIDIALTLDADAQAVALRCDSQHPLLGLVGPARAPTATLLGPSGVWQTRQLGDDVLRVDVRMPYTLAVPT